MKTGCFILLLFYTLSTGAKAQVALPDDVLTTLRTSHPRLLVRSLKDFERLKDAIPGDEFLSICSKAVMAHADSLLGTRPVEYILNKQLGGQLLEVSRTVYRRVYILAMAYRLTGNKK